MCAGEIACGETVTKYIKAPTISPPTGLGTAFSDGFLQICQPYGLGALNEFKIEKEKGKRRLASRIRQPWAEQFNPVGIDGHARGITVPCPPG
jgi:hypothetical protein